MLNRRAIIVVLIVLGCWSSCPAQESTPTPGPVLPMDEAVETALLANPNVQAAREQLAAAQAQFSGARANRLPQVDAALEYRRITSPPTFEVPQISPDIPGGEVIAASEENLIGSLTAEQAIYTGGRIPAQIDRAQALLQVAESQLAVTQAEVALATRQAYYGVLLAQALVRSAEQSLAAARGQLDVATARFEAGAAARFDVLRAQTLVSEAEQDLTEARNQVQIAEVALNRVLGVPLETDYTLAEPDLAAFPESDADALAAIAREERAEIAAAQARVAAAEAGIDLARSERRPQVGLQATYLAATEETAAQATGWTFLAVASIEVFDGGRTRANVNEARALRAEARANLEDVVRSVEQDVRTEYLNLQTALQTIETARTRLAQAQEAYDVAVVRYEAGVGTAVELADALATLTAARTNLNRAIFNYNIAYATLQRALGRVTYQGNR